MKNNLSIIIPTLSNVKGLQYLLKYFKDKPYKVIVVDNKKKNLGFAKGVNKGAKNVKTKWTLILNDDIEFESQKSKVKSQNYKEKVKSLIEEAERRKLDAISPILRNQDGKVENVGYKVLPYGKVELIREIPRLPFDSLRSLRVARNDRGGKIDGLTAACLLVKTSVFKKLKGFDEKFFAYLEDVDFFLRLASLAQDKSFGIAYNIEVLHNHMATTKTMGNFKARQDMVNWWRLYFKHKDKFRFNFAFIVERLRNISGYIKASL
jgi:GT2 family glycosyltransferase